MNFPESGAANDALMFPWHASDPPLRFDQFMAAALYDPRRGYYAKRIREVGARGDFSTSATLAPGFAAAVADWCRDALADCGCRDLIELGPGRGDLAAAIRRRWPRWRGPRLHLVERSEPLRALQQSRVGRRRIAWHDTVEDALEACGGAACLISNEFVDAFPVRRFRRNERGWSEHWLGPDGDFWEPVDALPESTLFDHPWPPGQIVEVHESYRTWLRDFAPHWRRGRMLTIDYGARAESLYQRRPEGSLRAYFHHQRLTGPEALARPGHQDLTCDVNFSDLVAWSGPFARVRSLVTQAEFLNGHADPARVADRFIADPDGAGGAFLCLDVERLPA